MKRPWMPLYVADYLRDTAHLRALESGAYLHLIMAYWVGGGLPKEDRQLATIAKVTDKEWRSIKPTMAAFFGPDFQSHKRIDAELEETARIKAANSNKARDAANRRWAKHCLEQSPKQCLEQCSEHDPSNAPECTLHTSQSKKDKTADADHQDYVFESGVIRLNEKDFKTWTDAFTNLDLRSELLSLTEWAEKQPKWFFAVAGALAKRNRELGIRRAAAQRGTPLTASGQPYPDGII